MALAARTPDRTRRWDCRATCWWAPWWSPRAKIERVGAGPPAICKRWRGLGRSPVERVARQKPLDGLGAGHEHAGAPGHDLRHAAEAFERRQVGVHRPLDLHSLGPHQTTEHQAPAVGKAERGAAAGQGLVDFSGARKGTGTQAERPAQRSCLLGIQNPADQRVTVIGLKPAHPQVFLGQPIPYREQQPGDDPEPGFGVAWQRLDFGVPERLPLGLVGVSPVGCGKRILGGGVAGGLLGVVAGSRRHVRPPGPADRAAPGVGSPGRDSPMFEREGKNRPARAVPAVAQRPARADAPAPPWCPDGSATPRPRRRSARTAPGTAPEPPSGHDAPERRGGAPRASPPAEAPRRGALRRPPPPGSGRPRPPPPRPPDPAACPATAPPDSPATG